MANISQDKRNLVWNLIASLVNASQSIIVIMIVSRVNTLDEAGIMSIAFSLANLFMNIGKYGMKNYQISHDGYDVSFDEFLKARIATVIMMGMSISAYSIYSVALGRYSINKALIIVGVCVWYGIEAFEDVYVGSLQSMGRLDVGNKLFISRWIVILGAFTIVDLLCADVLTAVLLADLFAFIIEIIGVIIVTKKYGSKNISSIKSVKELLIENLPLGISEVAYFYMTNISKYVIDAKMDDASQAIYGYIAMPVFVISLMNSIIYQPQLMGYIIDLREKRIDTFTNKIIKQIGIIIGMLLVCLAGAYVIGIQVLSLLYNTDLSQYRLFMMFLLTGGAFLAVGGFLSTMLTIMGKRKLIMIVYLTSVCVGVLITNVLVDVLALKGAVYGYLSTMIIMSTMFVIIMLFEVKKLKKY